MSTIHDQRFVKLVEQLRLAREKTGTTQGDLAAKLGLQQSDVSKTENGQRRLDVIELIDWLEALQLPAKEFMENVGLLNGGDRVVRTEPLPERGKAKKAPGGKGVLQQLAWQGQVLEILIENISVDQYVDIETTVSEKFALLNTDKNLKNRDAIAQALEYAISYAPKANPSDIYQHIVYRTYLREYAKSDAGQSWRRAGGEAVELFVEQHYRTVLASEGITLKALFADKGGITALKLLGIHGLVGDSKLDMALYGTHKGKQHIFGGVHCKASLAERVSDDEPCSRAMIEKGFVSYLFTFDSKSFPPPAGDLINRGELGTPANPTDKRKYVEEHGSFSACFSYNLRTIPSPAKTKSGCKIYSSTFGNEDPLPTEIVRAWKRFKKTLP